MGATLEYFNTTLSDKFEVPFEEAVDTELYGDEDWIALSVINDTIPGTPGDVQQQTH